MAKYYVSFTEKGKRKISKNVFKNKTKAKQAIKNWKLWGDKSYKNPRIIKKKIKK